LQIVIADEKESDIHSIFEVIYDFIESAVEPHGFVADYDKETEVLSPMTLEIDLKKLTLDKQQVESEERY
jgi:hypothetical protein